MCRLNEVRVRTTLSVVCRLNDVGVKVRVRVRVRVSLGLKEGYLIVGVRFSMCILFVCLSVYVRRRVYVHVCA